MDVLKALKQIPDESVDMQITSPPYWGLRDYGEGTESIWDGDESCEHQWKISFDKKHSGTSNPDWENDMSRGIRGKAEWVVESNKCLKCGAWKGQLGLEPDFNLFIKHLCDIFDEVKRVLKKDGTCWVNLGDTYSAGGGAGNGEYRERHTQFGKIVKSESQSLPRNVEGMQPKCLCGIPERFMLEMINRGWILRNKIIWHKPNHMPTSVKDRFANSWEYLFFFSKSKKYYFDLDAVREPHQWADRDKRSEQVRVQHKSGKSKLQDFQGGFDGVGYNPKGKNPDDVIQDDEWAMILKKKAVGGSQKEAYKRYMEWKRENPNKTYEDFYNEFSSKKVSKYQDEKWQEIDEKQTAWGRYGSFLSLPNPKGIVPQDFWNITTQPYPEAHFAVFPEKLVERPIKTTPKWICKKCGKARERIVDKNYVDNPCSWTGISKGKKTIATQKGEGGQPFYTKQLNAVYETKGWTSCSCNAGFRPAVILDIFAGSGTTLKVARDLKRDGIGIEIKPDYCDLIRKRLFGMNQQLFNDFELIK